MPVILKQKSSTVVDALRAVRNADDEISRIKENSWENSQNALSALVEDSDWKFGPGELIATFDHHLLVKANDGSLVQVEWEKDKESGELKLNRAVVHETTTPVSDLGQELMETAKAAVDLILGEDFDTAQPMINTLAEALDTGGDLQRRINNEFNIRALTRKAWWHDKVGNHAGIQESIPVPFIEGEDALEKSVSLLNAFVNNAAKECVEAVSNLSKLNSDRDTETLATDISEDYARAISALNLVNSNKQDEALQIYEAVMTVLPRLLNANEFLKGLTQQPAESVN